MSAQSRAADDSRWLTHRSRGTDALLPAVLRYIAERAPAARSVRDGGRPLELSVPVSEKAQTQAAAVLEGTTVRARRILAPAEPGFTAFLDGIQTSSIVAHLDGAPIVLGTVAGIIRERRNRRLVTAAYERRQALYVPRAFASSFRWEDDGPLRLVDTCAPAEGEGREDRRLAALSGHPGALAERAYTLIQRDREALETRLAQVWCARDTARGFLFVDGSIAASPRIGTAPRVAGVVKSHRVLYVEGDDMRVVLALGAGERSTMLRLSSQGATVATWYLRLRDPGDEGPLFGLVRVEVALDGATTERADEVSRWILAEATPLSLPDARWDTMVYGIRDCEQTLRAT